MSLVIAMVRGHQAVVVSDGAVSAYDGEGPPRRDANDCPKFRDVGAGLVVAATGSEWLIERMYAVVEDFVHRMSDGTFDHVAEFLSANLAEWNRVSVELRARANPVGPLNPNTSVLLLGYDKQNGRARMVGWQHNSGFKAREMQAVAAGVQTGLDLSKICDAARVGAPTKTVARLMKKAISAVSRADTRVGGHTYMCVVGPDYQSPQRRWAAVNYDSLASAADSFLVHCPKAPIRDRVNGGAWTTFDVTPQLTGSFQVPLSRTASQTIDIQAKDSDGNWGPSLTIGVGPYSAPAPTIAISIDPIANNTSGQASVSFRCDLPTNAQSAYWKVVTGPSATQPGDATVIATGTLSSTPSGVLNQTNVATVNLGDLIEIVVVPFTASAGAGTQMPSAHARSAYTTFGKTTTLTWYRSAWQEATAVPDYTLDASENILNPATGSTTIRRRFRIPVLLPAGVKLSTATFNVSWNTATNPLGNVTVGVDSAAGTNINFGSATYGGGAQSVSVGLSSTAIAVGNVVTLFTNFINSVAAAADGAQAYTSDCSLTYVTPTQDKLV